MANTPVIERFLQAIETAAIPGCDAWSADATLDATVPNWRLHAAGAGAIRAEYARWFAALVQFGWEKALGGYDEELAWWERKALAAASLLS